MIKLNKEQYNKIEHLIESSYELSARSLIKGIIPGEIYVDEIQHPSSALLKTEECILLVGKTTNNAFNSKVKSTLTFWDQITVDSQQWFDTIPKIHPNPYVRQWERKHYQISRDTFIDFEPTLKEGLIIEKINLDLLEEMKLINSDEILEWIEAWGSKSNFLEHGTGCWIRNDSEIISWSISDCSYKDKIALGVYTDEKYTGNGYGKIVVAAAIKQCFAMGYKTIDWLCTHSNIGSIAIAEKIGFKFIQSYYFFSSYPPIENPRDLIESEWYEWGDYLEEASKLNKEVLWDRLDCYIKSNHVENAIDIINQLKNQNMEIDFIMLQKDITNLQSQKLCSSFNHDSWHEYIKTSL